MQPPMTFSVMAAEPLHWADCTEVMHSLWDILCATFAIFWLRQIRSQNYNVMRGKASDRFFKQIALSPT